MTDDHAPAPPASYSTADVARRLGVSVPTVQRWVDAGHLKAWKTVGGHRRIDAESADRFIRTQALPPENAAPVAPPLPEAPTVVVVDDNPDDRDQLVALVETALPGAHVTAVENGFQGLVVIGRSDPDVVITDLVMPKMDGIEMLEQLAQHGPVRPRVLVAASSQSPASALPAGVRFARKPIDPDHFTALLREALAVR